MDRRQDNEDEKPFQRIGAICSRQIPVPLNGILRISCTSIPCTGPGPGILSGTGTGMRIAGRGTGDGGKFLSDN
jgi:hypothetical protein